MRLALAFIPLAAALAQPPIFTADRVLPSGGVRPTQLAPGMWISIYGDHLGPATPCTGNADMRNRETPSSARPHQSFSETLIFPTELCGVQVFLAGRAAGLQYAGDKQINFKVPQETPIAGEAELKVVYAGQSHSVTLRVGLETVALSLDSPAHAAGPVWLRIDPPFGWYDSVRYPIQIEPWNFGCQEIEVRRDGRPLPRTLPFVLVAPSWADCPAARWASPDIPPPTPAACRSISSTASIALAFTKSDTRAWTSSRKSLCNLSGRESRFFPSTPSPQLPLRCHPTLSKS